MSVIPERGMRQGRGMRGADSPLRALVSELYLAVVSPVGLRGTVRLAGLALLAEGLFLTLVSLAVPVGGLAALSVVVGEAALVASFVPER